MDATFRAEVPKLKKVATLEARRSINERGQVDYSTTKAEGDKTILKDVIARVMNAEMDADPMRLNELAVNDLNYKFKYKGQQERDGRNVYVFEVSPRKKKPGLFKGDIWVDEETALPIREAGRLVKSPSVFLKKVEFVREYQIEGHLAMPLRTQSLSETRFWGKAQVAVQYSNWKWDGALPAANYRNGNRESH
jgi:hypothetical protein